jgi:hypothetical protein
VELIARRQIKINGLSRMSNTARCEADLDDFFKATKNELLGELAARQKRGAPKSYRNHR